MEELKERENSNNETKTNIKPNKTSNSTEITGPVSSLLLMIIYFIYIMRI